jgi:hypothetical protein
VSKKYGRVTVQPWFTLLLLPHTLNITSNRCVPVFFSVVSFIPIFLLGYLLTMLIDRRTEECLALKNCEPLYGINRCLYLSRLKGDCKRTSKKHRRYQPMQFQDGGPCSIYQACPSIPNSRSKKNQAEMQIIKSVAQSYMSFKHRSRILTFQPCHRVFDSALYAIQRDSSLIYHNRKT